MSYTIIVIILFSVTLLVSAAFYYFVMIINSLPKYVPVAILSSALFVYLLLIILAPGNIISGNLVLLIAASALSVSAGNLLKTYPAIIAFIVAATLADIISFEYWPAHQIVDAARASGWGHAPLINFMSISFVMNDRIIPVVGAGDFFILGVFFIVLAQINASKLLQFFLPVSGLVLALTIGILTGALFAIPLMSFPVLIYLIGK